MTNNTAISDAEAQQVGTLLAGTSSKAADKVASRSNRKDIDTKARVPDNRAAEFDKRVTRKRSHDISVAIG